MRETLRFSLDKLLKISKENPVVASQSYEKALKNRKKTAEKLVNKIT